MAHILEKIGHSDEAYTMYQRSLHERLNEIAALKIQFFPSLVLPSSPSSPSSASSPSSPSPSSPLPPPLHSKLFRGCLQVIESFGHLSRSTKASRAEKEQCLQTIIALNDYLQVSKVQMAMGYFNLGVFYHHFNDKKSAQCLRQALEYGRSCWSMDMLAESHQYLGETLCDTDRQEEGLLFLKQSLQYYHQLNRHLEVAFVQSILCKVQNFFY